MKILDGIVQGEPDWHAARAKYKRTASLASAIMGASKHKTRTEAIAYLATGIDKEFSDWVQKNLLDKGHAIEAYAKPLAEIIAGCELYPSTEISDDEYLLASYDGLSLDDSIAWECKSWNETKAEAVMFGHIPDEDLWQVVQQLAIGAEKCLYMVTDGTEEKTVYCWLERKDVDDLVIQLLDGWKQADIDVVNYQPIEISELPQPQVSIDLPVLFANATGVITSSNMEEFGRALSKTLIEIRAITLETDLDFSNAKAAAKLFRERAKQMKSTKEAMLAQTESIGEASRKMDAWADDLNKTALQLEKDVEREDLAKKRAMITEASLVFAEYVRELEAETKPILLNIQKPDFAEAIKNKRNYTSMHDAIQTLLSQCKGQTDGIARDVRAKLAWCKENAAGHSSLFPDLQVIIVKPMEDFTMTITSRIEKQIADEAAKLEEQRKRIELEATAKAEREAAVKIAEAEAVIRADERAKAEAIASEAREESTKLLAEGIRISQESIARTSLESSPVTITAAIKAAMCHPITPADAVHIAAHETINEFMRINDFGSGKEKIRAVLIEFVKFQSTQK